jgi:3'-phosphoadenosine 5'-phosphosulfate sulfotransferase (PAPS reductase)/FAD synthetase
MTDPLQLAIWPAAEPDLLSFDWILINSSAGKDSQTCLRQTMQRCDAAGVPHSRILVVHCDLGRVEWRGAPELARLQTDHYGLRFEIVKRSQNDLLDHVAAHGKWPDNLNRYCTSDHKRGPVRTLMTRLADEWHGGPHTGHARRYGGRACRILNVMGMRADESPKRAKLRPFELDHENTRRMVWTWLPIHHWTVKGVWTDIHASGIPHHFAYDLGMPRLSCCFCIFASKSALILAGKHNPELLAEYVQVERDINHRFRVDVSLEEVQQAVRAGTKTGEVTDWRM